LGGAGALNRIGEDGGGLVVSGQER
jgi:hypothetical protein